MTDPWSRANGQPTATLPKTQTISDSIPPQQNCGTLLPLSQTGYTEDMYSPDSPPTPSHCSSPTVVNSTLRVLPRYQHCRSRLTAIIPKRSVLTGRVWLGATWQTPARMSRMLLRAEGMSNKMHVWVLGFAMLICASVSHLIEMPESFLSVPMENFWKNMAGAVDMFQDVCHPAVGSWHQLVESPGFLVRDPVSGEILDLSITSHADDVAQGKLFKDGQELQQLVLAEDMALSDSPSENFVQLSFGKQEHTVSVRGRDSWADMQRIYTAGFLTARVATSIKYLGCWLHHEGRQAQEITFSHQRCKRSMVMFGSFLVQIWHIQTSAHHAWYSNV